MRLVAITASQSSSDIRISKGVPGDAGVGDQDLDRSEGRFDLGECRLDLGWIGDIALDREHTSGHLTTAVGRGDPVAAATIRVAIPRPIPRLPPVIRTTREVVPTRKPRPELPALDAFTRSRYRGIRNADEEAYAESVTVSRTPPEPDLTGSDKRIQKAPKGPSTLITDARIGTSAEMSSRVRRYTITMAFRTACFVAMVFVDGPLLGAVRLRGDVAVYRGGRRQPGQAARHRQGRPAEPPPRPQLTTGDQADRLTDRRGSRSRPASALPDGRTADLLGQGLPLGRGVRPGLEQPEDPHSGPAQALARLPRAS